MADDGDPASDTVSLGRCSPQTVGLLRVACAQWGGRLVVHPEDPLVVVRVSRRPVAELRRLLRETIAALDHGETPP